MLKKLYSFIIVSSNDTQWNTNIFPHKSYRFNIIAAGDSNITTPQKRCTVYTFEEKTPKHYI
jgi:hypothetical protein